jgi:hypothetical protein
LFKLPAILSYTFWGIVLAIDVLLLYKYLRNRPSVQQERVVVPLPPPQKS